MRITAEYLIIVDKATNVALYDLCDRSEELKRLIAKNEKFVFEGTALKFENNPPCDFEISGGHVKGKDQRFFNAKLSFTGDEKKIDDFAKSTRGFRQLISDVGAQIETLSNDVSGYYSAKSYPILHKLENLMRKLLNYFMVIQIGKEWLNEASPKEVREALGKPKRSEVGDSLYDLDFKDLGGLLFKAYSVRTLSDLYEAVETASKAEDLDLSSLKEFKPKSNWERYFSDVVDCTDEYLKKRWEELYELRCKVAHNAIINKVDFERITTLAQEVSEKLENAIANISRVQVPEQEKELLAENLASNISLLTGDFLNAYRKFEFQLQKYVTDGNTEIEPSRFKPGLAVDRIFKQLLESTEIDEPTFKEAMTIKSVRDYLVHGEPIEISEDVFLTLIARTNRLTEEFTEVGDAISWKDEVVQALQSVGGEAHMVDIYEAVRTQTRRDLPRTWKSSVRKTLQSFCSTTKNFWGNEDLFVHVDVGRWGLRE